MASLDFPASPTTGQLFSAANGVTYMWNGTLWLVQAGPGGGTGDFFALGSSGTTNFSTPTVVIPATISSGNSGAPYNTSNGRYTPPAGRYNLFGFMLATVGAAANSVYIYLYKNGIAIGASNGAYGAATSAAVSLSVEAIVDANGTDYFELRSQSTGSAATIGAMGFGASPLTGMQGPMGPPFGGGTGDFYATSASTISLPTTGVTPVVFPTVTSGNAGSWYNSSTGRYTPPAGRYYLYSFGTFSQGAVNTMGNCYIRKNGVTLASANNQLYNANANAEVSVSVQADANGTDYFDIAWQSTQTNGIVAGGTNGFGAFPLTGMQGPQGPTGAVGSVPVIRVQKFTAGGTYTPHANMLSGYAVGIGGGGGGGGMTTTAAQKWGSGGGASGNKVTTYFLRAAVLPTVAVTIGAGATAVVATTGGTGGTTTFGALLTATGGLGGTAYVGGTANTGSAGDIIELGFTGGSGNFSDSVNTVPIGGSGGGRGGGAGAVVGASAAAGNPGLANSGGGGGGSAAFNVAGNITGSVGGSGYLYVVEYCSA